MSKSYMDFLLKHGAYKSEEEMYKLARKDVAEAFKKSLIPYKASKCMFLGAHDGGNKGRKFMKPYLKFWEETLLN